ncbi:hypothetical protein K378_02605 [Streptomyces sp. Amel2xB2]|nr:hypothetical protein [Streptomyces sp. Amel2xB2]RAJ66437.1 hypothetical protein K378_02605 [Streptomyces sp. Amel2xB2]
MDPSQDPRPVLRTATAQSASLVDAVEPDALALPTRCGGHV